jgi:hypothetical protein
VGRVGRGTVVVRVDPSLAFLLPLRDRAAGERRLRFDPDATVGHVVQSAGVPLTEVGELTLDGAPVEPSAPLQGPAASLRVVGGSGVL